MKDRVSTKILANGAIRYAQYNADGTLQGYVYLKPADDPTEDGTPLNKENLLSDTTALKMGCLSAENIVPDMALNKLNQFTFIVDSDVKFGYWVNNDARFNYKAVLIKSGSWTTNTHGVNLTATGTKIVVGEAGSILVFNDCSRGLYYSSRPTTEDCFMLNVNISISWEGEEVIGFLSCRNLYNCRCACVGGVDEDNELAAFDHCTNLYNCYAYANNADYEVSCWSYCYRDCSYLIRCSGRATARGSSATAYYECANLLACYGSAQTYNGINNAGQARVFEWCNDLQSCSVSSGGAVSASGDQYDFYACTGMAKCDGDMDTATCAAEYDGYSSAYAVANTANGGFNNDTY